MKPLATCLAVVCIALTGCATAPMPTASARPGVNLNRAITTATPGAGRIVVKRDTGFMGSGCTHRIHLDGEPVAEVRSGQAVSLYVSPGEHVVSAAATGICDGISEATVTVQLGKTRSLRSGYDGNGNIRLQPTAF